MFAAVASYCQAHEDKAGLPNIKQEGTKGLYKELKQRIHRCKELERVASKMRTRKNVMVSQYKVQQYL